MSPEKAHKTQVAAISKNTLDEQSMPVMIIALALAIRHTGT